MNSPIIKHRFLTAITALVIIGTIRTSQCEESFPQKIDQIIEATVQASGTKVADLSNDAEFVRRVHLDLVGVVPTATEAKEFLDDRAVDKRAALVDKLLERPEFALHMARVFDAMLIERRIATIPSYDVKAPGWRDWLAESFRQNKPWDQLVREILGSDGTDETNGAAAKFYLVRDTEPHLVARDIGRLMLGTDLQCAQCHDDPRIKSYHQADYFGLYAFVSRLKHFRDDEKKLNFVTEKAKGDVSFTSAFTGTEGETNPRLPNGRMIADPPLVKDMEYKVKPEKGQMGIPVYSRRSRLAEFLPRRETIGFSTNIANRMWGMMLGRGIVHPLDMHHADNPPSHPELLQLLADRLEQTDFDLRGLIRDIANSRTYQRSSQLPIGVTHEPDAAKFAVAALRPLTPEQLGWSILQVTGRLPSRVESYRRKLKETAAKSDATSKEELNEVDLDWQSHKQAYDFLSGELKPLFTVFSRLPGQPDNGFQPTVDQALYLLNSDKMVFFMKYASLFDDLVRIDDTAQLADELSLAVFSRYPTDNERSEIAKLFAGISDRSKRREILRQVLWGKFISAEFRLNH